jgi:hypothetical protein
MEGKGQGFKSAEPGKSSKNKEVYSPVLQNPPEVDQVKKDELKSAIDFLKQARSEKKDDSYYSFLLDLHINKKYGDREFFDFKSATTIFPLPVDKEDQKKLFILEANQRFSGSFISINIDKANGIVYIRNNLFVPPEISEDLTKTLDKIYKSNNPQAINAACEVLYNTIDFFGFSELNKQDAQRERGRGLFAFGNAQMADEMATLWNKRGELAMEKLRALAEGREVSVDLLAKDTSLKEKVDVISQKLGESRFKQQLDCLTGQKAIKRIEAGVEHGIYSAAEESAYRNAKAKLDEILSHFEGENGKLLLSRLSEGGLEGIPEEDKKMLQEAFGTIAFLETIAWKYDILASANGWYLEPQPSGPFPAWASKALEKIGESASMGPTRKTRGPAMLEVGLKMKRYCEMLRDRIDELTDLTPKERRIFKARVDTLLENIEKSTIKVRGPHGKEAEFSTPEKLASFSSDIVQICFDMEVLLSEKYETRKMKNPNLETSTRAASFIKVYTLRNALEIIGASALFGGAVGGLGTRSFQGAVAGAKVGWEVGGLLVGSAAIFNSAEAVSRYYSAPDDEGRQIAINDLRFSATYIPFAISGGAFGAVGGVVGRAGVMAGRVATGAGGAATAGANAFLMWDDIRMGRYLEIPTDVAYVAVGSVAFVRTLRGFVPVKLSKDLGKTGLVSASGKIFRSAIKEDIYAIAARPLKAGYSPLWVGVNAGFSLAFSLPQVYATLDGMGADGIGIAISHFSNQFSEITRGMVTFDFLLSGLGTPIRIAIAAKDAKYVAALASEGFVEEISQHAAKGGARLATGETKALMLDICFKTRGKVSADYVRETLGMTGENAAEEASAISSLVNKRWDEVRRGFAGGKAQSEFWSKFRDRMEDAATARKAAAKHSKAGTVVLLGALAAWELKNVSAKTHDVQLSDLFTEQETDFVNMWLGAADPKGKSPSAKQAALLEAVGTVNSLSAQIDAGDHPLAQELEFEGEESTRKHFLVSCAFAMIMSGKSVEDPALSELAKKAMEAIEELGGDPFVLSADTVFMITHSILRYKGSKEECVKALGTISGEGAPLEYSAAALYSAARSGRSREWAAFAAGQVSDVFKEEGMKYSTYELEMVFDKLSTGNEHSKKEILDAAEAVRSVGAIPTVSL